MDIYDNSNNKTNNNSNITIKLSSKKYWNNYKLKGKHSIFNNKMYNKYDIPARDILKDKLGDYLIDNPDPVQQDMIINSDKCKYKYLEIQVCTSWINKNFPRRYPYIYERKIKYRKNNDTLFIMFDKYFKECLIFDIEKLVSEKPIRVKKYSREFLYEIPWYRCRKILTKFITQKTFDYY